MSSSIISRRITWEQFYAVTDRPRPTGFIPAQNQRKRAANDNRPVTTFESRVAGRERANTARADTADQIAAQRAKLASRAVGAVSASTPSRVAVSLAKSDASTVKTLFRLRELMRPAQFIADNDNAYQSSDDEDGNRGWGMERVHNQGNIKPSPREILRAYKAGKDIGVQITGSRVRIGENQDKRFIGLLFNAGLLLAYGDRKGRKKRPNYEDGALTKPSKTEEEKAAELLTERARLASYIRLKRGPVLQGYLVDSFQIGSMRWSRYSPGVANEYGRLGGISVLKGVGEGRTSAPMRQELAESERTDAADDFVKKLDAPILKVVRSILDADNFTEIAQVAGKLPTAHNGKRIAIATLRIIENKLAA